MRRGSKRGIASVSTGSSKTQQKELDGINKLFEQFRDKSSAERVIGPDGVEQLCEEIAVPPSDIRMLMFSWKLKASRMGYFAEDEWRTGLLSLHADTIDKVKECFPALEKETQHPMIYREFFKYAFEFCCTEPRQKTLDIDTASQMLSLIMPNSIHTEPFLQFLQEQKEYKALTMDQWQGFLRFCEECVDASNYDESEAWPLIIDNFVEWLRAK